MIDEENKITEKEIKENDPVKDGVITGDEYYDINFHEEEPPKETVDVKEELD